MSRCRMVSLPALLLACLALGASAMAAESVEPASLTIASRVSYLLGDGQRPFLDEDGRRALLGFSVSSDRDGTILGYQDLVIDQAVSDAGEVLATTLPATSGTGPGARPRGERGERGRERERGAALFSVGLPAAGKPYGGLTSLRGHLVLISNAARARTWTTTLAACGAKAPVAIDGHPELTLHLVPAPDPTHTMLQLSPAARWAVVAIEVIGADGVALTLRSPRIDHHDPPQAIPGVEKIDTMTWPQELPATATLSVRYYPTVQLTPVAFALTAIPFGVQLPSAAALLHGQPRGANDL